MMLFETRAFKGLHVVTSRSFPAACPYNAPGLAVATLNMMAAQSVSIDEYQEGDQQVGLTYSNFSLLLFGTFHENRTLWCPITCLFSPQELMNMFHALLSNILQGLKFAGTVPDLQHVAFGCEKKDSPTFKKTCWYHVQIHPPIV